VTQQTAELFNLNCIAIRREIEQTFGALYRRYPFFRGAKFYDVDQNINIAHAAGLIWNFLYSQTDLQIQLPFINQMKFHVKYEFQPETYPKHVELRCIFALVIKVGISKYTE